MNSSQPFLIAVAMIFGLPFLFWRLGNTDYYAPLPIVQILAGIVLGPGLAGAAFPNYYAFVFSPPVVTALNGIASWAVVLFVWIAGIELDVRSIWTHRRESSVAASLLLGTPLLLGCVAGAALALDDGWIGSRAHVWQFILGIGMSCSVTALPILVLLMKKLDILDQPIGQRILRYASLDDVAIWGVLALILTDWARIFRQMAFLAAFALSAFLFRKLMRQVSPTDRWYAALIWLALCAFGADWSGLHFMVGAFLAGVAIDKELFDGNELESLRNNVLLVLMPVFFLSTGLKTNWSMGGRFVVGAAAMLLVATVAGKLAGTALASRILGWQRGESSIIGWLLQTKALIMIIFVNVLLDEQIVTSNSFTALLLMATASTMLTVPFVTPRLKTLAGLVIRSK